MSPRHIDRLDGVVQHLEALKRPLAEFLQVVVHRAVHGVRHHGGDHAQLFIAMATLAARTADVPHAGEVLAEPVRFVRLTGT